MAKYQRQATNKYYGAANAGYVATGSATDGLAKALTNAGYKVGKAEELRIDRKKDKAIAKIDELYANGKSFETIQSEIISGKHPELTGKYIDATTNYHAGKVKAHETIEAIILGKKQDGYDPRDESTNLDMFYKKYMPDTSSMDSATLLGFTKHFNQFRAKDALIDADIRGDIAVDKKITEGVGILSDEPTETLKKNLPSILKDMQVPLPMRDGTGSTLLYTNAETLAVVRRSIVDIIANAKTETDLNRADVLLNTNLGYSKNGSAIGTIASRKSKEILVIQEKLEAKRRALIINDRTESKAKEQELVKNINAAIFEPVTEIVEGKEVTRDKTYAEKMELRDKLEEIGVSSYIENFDRLMRNNTYIDTDPAVYNQLVSSIYDGEFTSQEEISQAINELNIDPRLLAPTLSLFESWSKSSTRQGSVHTTNTTYKEGLKYIENAVRGNFTSGGILKENGNQAIRNAHNYMKKELYDFEFQYEKENGKQPSTFEREEFLQKMGDIVIKNFTEGNIAPSLKSMPEYEQQIKEDEEAKKVKDEKYELAEIPDMVQTVSNILSNNQLGNTKLINETLDKFDPSFAGIPFTGGDSAFGESDAESKIRFANEQLPTVVAQILNSSNFSQTQMDALEQGDYENLLKTIATGLGNNVTTEIVDAALTILRGKNK
jgi:hypothetical protein